MNTTSNSNSLFHYTKTYDNLCGILRNGFKPNYCKETLLNGSIIGLPMVSLCDIPITRANDFRKYGKYAIGMERNWGTSKGINPITYIASEKISSTYSMVLNLLEITSNRAKGIVLKEFLSGIKTLIENNNKIGNDIRAEEMLKLYQKQEPAITLFKLFNEVENTLVGYTKLYESEDQKHGRVINYNDNEWRYIVPANKKHKWLHGEEEFAAWRGNSIQKPISTFEAIGFDSDDIRYIIVEKETDAKKLIGDILKMKTIGGNKFGDKNTLLLKKLQMIKNIISIERLDEDF